MHTVRNIIDTGTGSGSGSSRSSSSGNKDEDDEMMEIKARSRKLIYGGRMLCLQEALLSAHVAEASSPLFLNLAWPRSNGSTK